MSMCDKLQFVVSMFRRAEACLTCLSSAECSATMAHERTAKMFRAHFYRTRFWLPALTVAAFVIISTSNTVGQTSPQGKATPDPGALNPQKEERDPRFGSPEGEMRSKAILKEAKKNYDENLARAREVSELATQLNDVFEKKRSFSS